MQHLVTDSQITGIQKSNQKLELKRKRDESVIENESKPRRNSGIEKFK